MLRSTLCTSCFCWWQPSIFFHPANNSFLHFEWLNSSLSQSVTSCTPMKRKVSLNLPQQCCFTILTFFSPDLSPETSTYSMLSFSLCSHVCMTSNATTLSDLTSIFIPVMLGSVWQVCWVQDTSCMKEREPHQITWGAFWSLFWQKNLRELTVEHQKY